MLAPPAAKNTGRPAGSHLEVKCMRYMYHNDGGLGRAVEAQYWVHKPISVHVVE